MSRPIKHILTLVPIGVAVGLALAPGCGGPPTEARPQASFMPSSGSGSGTGSGLGPNCGWCNEICYCRTGTYHGPDQAEGYCRLTFDDDFFWYCEGITDLVSFMENVRWVCEWHCEQAGMRGLDWADTDCWEKEQVLEGPEGPDPRNQGDC